MKVLHILDHSVPLFSGYSFRSRSIIHAQRALGLQPVVLTSPKHDGSTSESRFTDYVVSLRDADRAVSRRNDD